MSWGHLDRATFRYKNDGTVRPHDIRSIVCGGKHTGGVVGYALEFSYSPAIIVHNRGDRIEARLRWLSTRAVDNPEYYAPDISTIMLSRSTAIYLYGEERWPELLLKFLKSWAFLHDWGQRPEVWER